MTPRDRGTRQDVVISTGAVSDLTGGRRPGGIVEQLVESQIRAEREAERKTKRTPHEERRVTRRLNISFPTVEWKEAVLDQAKWWGVRTSDFMTFCVAFTMQAIEEGNVERIPRTGPTRFYHRAGETLELPWSPDEGPKENGSEEDRWT